MLESTSFVKLKSTFLDCLGVVICPLPKNEGIAEDYGAQKPSNSSQSRPVVAERQKSTKERAGQIVRSWTVQNEMRCVLGWMSAGAA